VLGVVTSTRDRVGIGPNFCTGSLLVGLSPVNGERRLHHPLCTGRTRIWPNAFGFEIVVAFFLSLCAHSCGKSKKSRRRTDTRTIWIVVRTSSLRTPTTETLFPQGRFSSRRRTAPKPLQAPYPFDFDPTPIVVSGRWPLVPAFQNLKISLEFRNPIV